MEVIIVVAAIWIFAKIVKALLRGYGKSNFRDDR
jgi:hypothetical protein